MVTTRTVATTGGTSALDDYTFFKPSGWIGFDSLFDELGQKPRFEQHNYPPYNIIRLNDYEYQLELAVSGFSDSELDITVTRNADAEGQQLIITGVPEKQETEPEYIQRGISRRKFEIAFRIGEHVIIEKASRNNGLLVINLKVDVPEELQPRKIKIQ